MFSFIDYQHFFKIFYYRFFRRQKYTQIVIITFTSLIICYIFGVIDTFSELYYNDTFIFKLSESHLKYFVEAEKNDSINDKSFKKYRQNNFTYNYIFNPQQKCKTPPKLFIVVRTSACNWKERLAIRETWGNETQLKRVRISTVFMLGNCQNQMCLSEDYSQVFCQELLRSENNKYNDIIQGDFLDTYLNSTEKMFAAFNWLQTYCFQTEYAFFVDDDFYVSVSNLLKSADKYSQLLTNGYLYMGHVFQNMRPMRKRFSRHYISVSEYPFSRYPPYATGGCFLLNNTTLIDLYFGSLHIPKFRFDDVFLGLIARHLKIDIIDNEHIYIENKATYRFRMFHKVIASHWYNDPDELKHVWNEQKKLGNA